MDAAMACIRDKSLTLERVILKTSIDNLSECLRPAGSNFLDIHHRCTIPFGSDRAFKSIEDLRASVNNAIANVAHANHGKGKLSLRNDADKPPQAKRVKTSPPKQSSTSSTPNIAKPSNTAKNSSDSAKQYRFGPQTPRPADWKDPQQVGAANWEGKATCTDHKRWVSHEPSDCLKKPEVRKRLEDQGISIPSHYLKQVAKSVVCKEPVAPKDSAAPMEDVVETGSASQGQSSNSSISPTQQTMGEFFGRKESAFIVTHQFTPSTGLSAKPPHGEAADHSCLVTTDKLVDSGASVTISANVQDFATHPAPAAGHEVVVGNNKSCSVDGIALPSGAPTTHVAKRAAKRKTMDKMDVE
ncbi:hypothetical protein HDV05_002095, partial [Chytridiales sp. JEL 0842]